MKKVLIALFITISLALYGCSQKTDKITVDYEQAEIEIEEYITSLELPSYFWSTGVDQKESGKFDVTGDGYDDLIRFPFYGSGMSRTSVAVYDPVNHAGYFLGSFDESYSLVNCTEKELLICKSDNTNTENSSVGTLSIEDGKLYWVEKK